MEPTVIQQKGPNPKDDAFHKGDSQKSHRREALPTTLRKLLRCCFFVWFWPHASIQVVGSTETTCFFPISPWYCPKAGGKQAKRFLLASTKGFPWIRNNTRRGTLQHPGRKKNSAVCRVYISDMGKKTNSWGELASARWESVVVARDVLMAWLQCLSRKCEASSF